MTSQFIQNNNQSLLWKIISNTPQTIQYFSNAPYGEKERWFQSVIGHIYNKYKGQNISLRDINKKAIDLMLQSLQEKGGHSEEVYVQNEEVYRQKQEVYQKKQEVQYETVKSREQQLTEQFNRRQAEYESMVKKETPAVHFTENIKDEAITDINSAVNEYMKERNNIIIPTPPPAILKQQQQQQKKLDLTNAEPISLMVEEIEEKIDINKSGVLPKKVVQWGENQEHVFGKNESITENARFTNIEKELEQIKSKLDIILSSLNNIKQNI